MRRNAADVKRRFPAMMKKTQPRERQLDRSVTTRDAESEIAADLAVGHRHRVTPCCPLAPTQARCYAMKGVMHPQVEVLADNEFEEVHQVISQHQLFLLLPFLFPFCCSLFYSLYTPG